jgi:hypothetical protein
MASLIIPASACKSAVTHVLGQALRLDWQGLVTACREVGSTELDLLQLGRRIIHDIGAIVARGEAAGLNIPLRVPHPGEHSASLLPIDLAT